MKQSALGRFTVPVFLVLMLSGARPSTAQRANETCRPTIRFGTVLSGVTIASTGVLGLGPFYAVCLPDPVRQSSSSYPYDPDDGGKLSTVLKGAGGQVLTTYVWYAEKISTLWQMDRYKIVGGPAEIKRLLPGDYVLDFCVEDKPFFRLPFSVSNQKNNDVYNPGLIFSLDGPWNDYASLGYPNPNRYLQFSLWLRDREQRGKKGTHYDLRLIRKKDGKVLAGDWGDDAAVILKPGWTAISLYLNRLKNERPENGSTEFPVAEVLKNDGDYVVTLSLESKPYGEYPFKVSDGKILPQGNQDRPNSNPLMFIEAPDQIIRSPGALYWLKRRTL
jgi:hypothetical protein